MERIWAVKFPASIDGTVIAVAARIGSSTAQWAGEGMNGQMASTVHFKSGSWGSC
jgi:hypothetical protein